MERALSPAGKFTGPIDQLMDLIKFFCLSQMNYTIRVEPQEGAGGRIHVRSGQVIHAELGGLQGEKAFYTMMRWKEARFETVPVEENVPASIKESWEALMAELWRLCGGKAVKEEDAGSDPLFQRVQKMKVPEKIRLAMIGDKEARTLLIRDSNRMVQLAVVMNGRISESEVGAIANSRNIDEEVLRRIASNREWAKLYPIRLALAKNPKTPIAISVRMVQTLLVQDLKQIAKSKGVPSAVAQTARRMIANRE